MDEHPKPGGWWYGIRAHTINRSTVAQGLRVNEDTVDEWQTRIQALKSSGQLSSEAYNLEDMSREIPELATAMRSISSPDNAQEDRRKWCLRATRWLYDRAPAPSEFSVAIRPPSLSWDGGQLQTCSMVTPEDAISQAYRPASADLLLEIWGVGSQETRFRVTWKRLARKGYKALDQLNEELITHNLPPIGPGSMAEGILITSHGGREERRAFRSDNVFSTEIDILRSMKVERASVAIVQIAPQAIEETRWVGEEDDAAVPSVALSCANTASVGGRSQRQEYFSLDARYTPSPTAKRGREESTEPAQWKRIKTGEEHLRASGPARRTVPSTPATTEGEKEEKKADDRDRGRRHGQPASDEGTVSTGRGEEDGGRRVDSEEPATDEGLVSPGDIGNHDHNKTTPAQPEQIRREKDEAIIVLSDTDDDIVPNSHRFTDEDRELMKLSHQHRRHIRKNFEAIREARARVTEDDQKLFATLARLQDEDWERMSALFLMSRHEIEGYYNNIPLPRFGFAEHVTFTLAQIASASYMFYTERGRAPSAEGSHIMGGLLSSKAGNGKTATCLLLLFTTMYHKANREEVRRYRNGARDGVEEVNAPKHNLEGDASPRCPSEGSLVVACCCVERNGALLGLGDDRIGGSRLSGASVVVSNKRILLGWEAEWNRLTGGSQAAIRSRLPHTRIVFHTAETPIDKASVHDMLLLARCPKASRVTSTGLQRHKTATKNTAGPQSIGMIVLLNREQIVSFRANFEEELTTIRDGIRNKEKTCSWDVRSLWWDECHQDSGAAAVRDFMEGVKATNRERPGLLRGFPRWLVTATPEAFDVDPITAIPSDDVLDLIVLLRDDDWDRDNMLDNVKGKDALERFRRSLRQNGGSQRKEMAKTYQDLKRALRMRCEVKCPDPTTIPLALSVKRLLWPGGQPPSAIEKYYRKAELTATSKTPIERTADFYINAQQVTLFEAVERVLEEQKWKGEPARFTKKQCGELGECMDDPLGQKMRDWVTPIGYHIRRSLQNPKLKELWGEIEEVEKTQRLDRKQKKIVVVSDYPCVAAILIAWANMVWRGRVAYCTAHGTRKSVEEERRRLTARFQDEDDGEVFIMIGCTSVCQTGLNWQVASVFVYMEASGEINRVIQVLSRVQRKGQKEQVKSLMLVLTGAEAEGRKVDRLIRQRDTRNAQESNEAEFLIDFLAGEVRASHDKVRR